MADTLAVHINRGDVHAIDVADAFDAAGPFTVALHNHGSATHVHLHLDDALSRVAHLGAVNHYVDAEETRTVEVSVASADREVDGELEVVTGYGAERAVVAVSLTSPPEVTVDESLGTPQVTDRDAVSVSRDNVIAGGVALSAVVVAAVVLAAVVGETLAIALGLGALAVGVAAAVYLLQAD